MMKICKRNKYTFPTICAFAAFYPITPDYFRIFGMPAQIFEVFLCLALLIVFSGFKLFFLTSGKTKNMYYITLLWAVSMTVIYLLHASTYAILSILVPWCFLFSYLIKNIDSKEKFLKIIDVLITTAFIVAVIAIGEEATGINLFSYLNNSGAEIYMHEARLGVSRVYSFASHPNSYCLYCMFIEALVFYRLFCTKVKNNIYLKIVYVVVFISACCTASRSVIISIVITQLIFLWICGYKKFLKYLLFLLLSLIGLLFIISAIFPDLYKSISGIFVFVMAVFSDSYADKLQGLGYQWSASGVADRFELWNIVFSKMKGYYLIGHGPSSLLEGVKTTNSLGVSNEKSSIEVQFLVLLYRYGIFAALIEEIRNIIQFKFAYKNRKRFNSWESKIGFNKLCFVVLFAYFLVLFTLNQTDTARVYLILSSLFFAYNYQLNLKG